MSCNRTVPFNIPPCVGDEIQFVQQAVEVNHKIAGDGLFAKKCNEWLESRFNSNKILLTTSGTSALEMAAILCDLKPGDEVILPSFTFTSTATAFVLAGAKLVFVDIRPDTMNIDETKIESAITERTRVIVPVHYAGVACEMDTIMDIARRHNLLVVEDAAQAVIATYKGRALGTIGDFGCYSFHETKNYSMGEGGAISINNSAYCDRAEIIREKGTNRAQFFRGQVAKYNWVDFGSSYLPSEDYIGDFSDEANAAVIGDMDVFQADEKRMKKAVKPIKSLEQHIYVNVLALLAIFVGISTISQSALKLADQASLIGATLVQCASFSVLFLLITLLMPNKKKPWVYLIPMAIAIACIFFLLKH